MPALPPDAIGVVPGCEGIAIPGCDDVFMSEFIGCPGICDGADGVVDGIVDDDEFGAGFMPSFVVPVCGAVAPDGDMVVPDGELIVSEGGIGVPDGDAVEPDEGIVESVPPGGVGAGAVWASAAEPISRAVAKAIVFMTLNSIAAPGTGAVQKG